MNYFNLYADFLKQHFSLEKKLKIVADCSNGTAGFALKELGIIPNLELILINDNPDPEFPAHGPNPLKEGATKQLAEEVTKQQADFGVAFDADADRAFFVDEKGEILSSFMIAVLLFKHRRAPFVTDELVYKSLEHLKLFKAGDVLRSKIGTFNVKSLLRTKGASTAAEYSGHYYFDDFFKNDSGIFTMITVANTISRQSESLSEFIHSLPSHSVAEDAVKLGDKKWEDIAPRVEAFAKEHNAKMEYIDGITLDTGDTWVNVRLSNTEPIAKIIGGGTNINEVKSFIEKLKALV